MLDENYKELNERMNKTLVALSREFSAVRTGKASPHLLDNVTVDAYGSKLPLIQVATVNSPEPRLLVVQAFDKSTVGDVVKGIQAADLGLNPQVDGSTIRVPIPPLNEERRKQLVKQCKNLAEESKVAIRNIRRDANELFKQMQKDKDISEDQEHDAHDRAQKLTDDHIKQIDTLLNAKEAEVMEV